MKIPRVPHPWRLTIRQAIAVQDRLAGLVLRECDGRSFRRAAGLDAAFSADDRFCLAGVVLWDIEEHVVIEHHTSARRVRFPYIPGLLSFREAPALLAALAKLRRVPDVVICDGQGIAHPRRFGIASHIGLILDMPSVGCAKSRLTGTSVSPGAQRGASVHLTDKGEIVGAVVRSKTGVKPVYVSIGHRIDLANAVALVLESGCGRRLPEPTRLADRLVAAAKLANSKYPVSPTARAKADT